MNNLPEFKFSSEAGLPQEVAEHLAGEISDGFQCKVDIASTVNDLKNEGLL